MASAAMMAPMIAHAIAIPALSPGEILLVVCRDAVAAGDATTEEELAETDDGLEVAEKLVVTLIVKLLLVDKTLIEEIEVEGVLAVNTLVDVSIEREGSVDEMLVCRVPAVGDVDIAVLARSELAEGLVVTI